MRLPEPEYLTLEEASAILRCTVERIKWFISEGHLTTFAVDPPRPLVRGRQVDLRALTRPGYLDSLSPFSIPGAFIAKLCRPVLWRQDYLHPRHVEYFNRKGDQLPPPVRDSSANLFQRLRFEASNIRLATKEIHALRKYGNKDGSALTASDKKPSKTREDALGKILITVVGELSAATGKPPTSIEVFKHLKKLAKRAEHPVIQEVRGNCIYWKRANGTEEETDTAALVKRLTRLKKNYPLSLGG